jgi:Flp pilus assembly protein TadD
LRAALIVLAVLLVYLPAFRAGFVWDDEQLVWSNPLLRDFSGLLEIWSGGRTADYFPVTNSVFWIEHHLLGEIPVGYHIVNIVLQAAAAVLVWRVLHQLKIPGAWLTGLIFGIHPVHAESVAWISELKNVLAMFFALLSILWFLKSTEQRRRRVVYAGSIVFFALALLSKTQTVFVPVVLLLCLWWRDPKSVRTDAIRTWPFFLLAAVLSAVTIWFQNRGIGEEEIVTGSFPRRLVNAGMAVWWYAGKVFLPFRLTAIYPPSRFDPPQFWEWLPLIGLILLLALLWHFRNRGTRGVFFAVSYFAVALFPVLGLVRMAYLRSGTLVADHLQYFADVSLIALACAAATTLATRGREARVAIISVAVILVGTLGSYTWCRAQVFHDEKSLWTDTLAKNRDAWQAHARLGQYFFNAERFPEAIDHLQSAVELKPELAEHHNLLGLAYCRVERFEEGIVEYRKSLELREAKASTARAPAVATTRTNLGNALAIVANRLAAGRSTIPEEALRRYDEAIAQYEKALELDPNQAAVHRNLGMVLARLGRYDEAETHLRITLQIAPNEPTAHELLDQIEARRR